MLRRLEVLALHAFGLLSDANRQRLVRLAKPSYTLGAMCLVERSDGHVLLVRHSYRRRWGLPGGLVDRHEDPETAVRREVREEVGVEVTLIGEPVVVVDPIRQRVDFVYRGRSPHDGPVEPTSIEIVEVAWFAPGVLPGLQPEVASALDAVGADGERRSTVFVAKLRG